MNKTFNQKENIVLYIIILILLIGVYIFGVWLVNYHAWVVFAPFLLILFKVIKIYKTPETPIIKLTDTEIHFIPTNKTFTYDEIEHIHLNSKWLNGHLLKKNSNKRETFHSVAIALEDQKEIREFVLRKISASNSSKIEQQSEV